MPTTAHTTGRSIYSIVTDEVERGGEDYSKEELIAEFGSAFLCGHAGIAPKILENAAAYIQNWKEKLQQDSRLLISAASQAQKAANFILQIPSPSSK